MMTWQESELFGIKSGGMAPEIRAAFKVELATVTELANKLTKVELLAAAPGPGLMKFSKAALVMRAITLHMAKWEAEQEVA